MAEKNWSKKQELEFKGVISAFFAKRIKDSLLGNKNPLFIGDNLAEILKNSDEEVAKIIIPRAVTKWTSEKTFPKWQKILKDPQMSSELRVIGRSIANTMRPLAGNNFTLWVAAVLNQYFDKNKIPLKAVTSGVVKQSIVKAFATKKGKDYKPDIDIILIRVDQRNKPVVIISAKTTLAERVMQTINWSRYLPIPVFLVTAWEDFESGTNRERVQELDGVYVCNPEIREYGKIKRFSEIAKDLKRFY